MRELPSGWTNITLADAGPLVGGKTPSKSSSAYWDRGTVPWISPKDMKSFVLVKSEDMITPHAVDDAGMEVLPVDSVLMVTRSGILEHTFPVAITTMETSINQDIKALRPSRRILSRYAAYALRSFGPEILTQCSKEGTTVASVNTEALEKFPLPLAPRDEQKRITAKLDAVLAKVDMCHTRLDRVPQILNKFREAVLEAAVSGRLTEEWRQSMTGEKWTSSSINDLCSTTFDGPFGSHLKSADYSASGIRVVRLENIGHLQFRGDLQTFISRAKYRSLEKHTLLKDDLVFSSFVDEEVRVCLVPESLGLAINKADCFCLRIAPEKAIPQFVAYRLATPDTYRDMKAMVRGVTRPRINISHLKGYAITVPPILEQAEIVRRVDELFAIADKLQRRYEDVFSQVEMLTPSVLAKAFRGELVPQDPNDEPTGEMLERVRAVHAGETVKRHPQ